MTRKGWTQVAGVLAILACWPAPASAQLPDFTLSYYVPQAVLDGIGVVEGDEAIPYFRACPNNDGDSSLPNNARIKVVLLDSGGIGIAGISPADICILFNGGTAAQGFGGSGADSVIANSIWNPSPPCPDVRCVPADAPTDANGVTYITFTGPGGVRDPNRKWGHYDTVFPVSVLGSPLSGRLTSASANGSYVLRIKNFDHTGGLAAIVNQGETVTVTDFNAIANNLGVNNALSYWRDLDSSGEVDLADFNMLVFHITHDCDTPNNP
jgi:hypothetical protein